MISDPLEHFAAFEDRAGWVALCPVDAPLLQVGDLTFGRWAEHLHISRACFYSWVTNNFWYTNFPGTQSGHLRFRYALTSGAGPLDPVDAEAFACAVRVGLTVRG